MRWPNLLRKDLDHGKGRTITKLRGGVGGGGGFDWGILGLHEFFSRFVFFFRLRTFPALVRCLLGQCMNMY